MRQAGTRWGSDDVAGEVIGEVTPFSGDLFYGGRLQGQRVHGATTAEVETKLRERMDRLKREYAGVCYNTGEKWELRVSW